METRFRCKNLICWGPKGTEQARPRRAEHRIGQRGELHCLQRNTWGLGGRKVSRDELTPDAVMKSLRCGVGGRHSGVLVEISCDGSRGYATAGVCVRSGERQLQEARRGCTCSECARQIQALFGESVPQRLLLRCSMRRALERAELRRCWGER